MSENPSDRKFALRLMLAQEARGLTQAQLADKADVSRSVICQLLKGEKLPNYNTLISLAKQLNVSTDYLCGMEKQS